MMGMKMDEEFVPDRRMEVETDDEDNEAETDCPEDDEDDETGSDCELPPSSHSHINYTNDPWPQTYRYIWPPFILSYIYYLCACKN